MAAEKRSGEDAGLDEAEAKRSKVPEPAATEEAVDEEDEFDALLGSGVIEQEEVVQKDAPEESSRQQFVDKLASMERIEGDALSDLIEELQARASTWNDKMRWRCSALFLVYVGRSSRICRAAFVAEGLPLLGSVLQEGVSILESTEAAADRQEAGMWVLACLSCLKMLPIGRATMWEHRAVLGKPFDRLHRWCGQQRSALAAELRGPTTALCRRWRKQPKPAEQETDIEKKALRRKVVDMIAQGLNGIAGLNSPASPGIMPSPGRLPPVTSAAEVEAVLFSRYNSNASAEYRQHARMLRSNLALPSNIQLREGILSGDVSPDELVAMNSNALAPEALQEQRLMAKQRAMREAVLKVKLKPPDIKDADGRTDYNPATAPPLLEKQSSSSDVTVSDIEAMPPPMPPPPTPFQESLAGAATGLDKTGFTPDVTATPAPGQEDEDETILIQWLSRPI